MFMHDFLVKKNAEVHLIVLVNIIIDLTTYSYPYQTKTMLGDHLTNVGINRDNVSEVLQMYMSAHCANTELAPLALSLKTKAFQAHTPAQKASILGFLANELACSKPVIR